MATTPFSTKVLNGASQPRFSLLGGNPVIQKLAGTWTWAEGSTQVLVDTDITKNVVAGDRLKAFSDGKFFTINSLSYSEGTGNTTIVLTSAFDESPDLVTNGKFANWTGDNPDNWTVQNETGAGDEVTEAVKRCNIVDSGGNNVGIYQSILTAGRQYKATLDIDTVTLGKIVVNIGSASKAFSIEGDNQTWIATASNSRFLIKSQRSGTPPTDIIFDDVSVIRYSTEAFIDRESNVRLPHTSDTLYEFIPVRNDGGSPVITLESGEIVNRIDGYRVRVTLFWKRMVPFEFKKIIQIRNWVGIGQIILIPHEDVGVKFDVLPESSLTPSNPGDLFDGHEVRETYVSRTLIKSIPTAEAVSGLHSVIF